VALEAALATGVHYVSRSSRSSLAQQHMLLQLLQIALYMLTVLLQVLLVLLQAHPAVQQGV
jgi:hypothetical protein